MWLLILAGDDNLFQTVVSEGGLEFGNPASQASVHVFDNFDEHKVHTRKRLLLKFVERLKVVLRR